MLRISEKDAYFDRNTHLYYSKKLHGDRMMKSIMPDVLEGKCKRFFKPVYHELADFDVEKEELEKSGAF